MHRWLAGGVYVCIVYSNRGVIGQSSLSVGTIPRRWDRWAPHFNPHFSNESGEMSDQDYTIDTTGDLGARIQSIHAFPYNARSCMTKISIHFLCADVDHNDANDDMVMIRSSSGDDDSTDDEYVDKSTARDLQSRFRTVGGLKGTIADEEIAD